MCSIGRMKNDSAEKAPEVDEDLGGPEEIHIRGTDTTQYPHTLSDDAVTYPGSEWCVLT